MSRPVRFSLAVLAALCLAIAFFRTEISQFLFDPEGLSLAADELCLANMTDIEVIAKISVDKGASSTTLLTAGEMACSQSPVAGNQGVVLVSLIDGEGPYCEQAGTSGKVLKLTAFDPPSNCVWEQ